MEAATTVAPAVVLAIARDALSVQCGHRFDVLALRSGVVNSVMAPGDRADFAAWAQDDLYQLHRLARPATKRVSAAADAFELLV